MQRVDWIWLGVGVAGAITLVVVGFARGTSMDGPFWAMVALVAFAPLARTYGRRSAREKGRELRKRRSDQT